MRRFRVRGTSAGGAPGYQCKMREVVGFRGAQAEVAADPQAVSGMLAIRLHGWGSIITEYSHHEHVRVSTHSLDYETASIREVSR